MGKKTVKKAKLDEEEEQLKPLSSKIVQSSDDEEANEDLSLKIVEKARLRACTTRNDTVLPAPVEAAEVVKVVRKKKVKKVKKKTKPIEADEDITVSTSFKYFNSNYNLKF